MPMVSLKRTKKDMEAEKKKYENVGIGSDEVYPYGTRINFDKDQIKKIPHLKTAKAGDIVNIEAIGKIVEVRITDNDGGRDRHHIEIQIQKIDIGSNNESDEKDAFES